MNGRKIVVNKSTVPVGTADAVTARIIEGLEKYDHDYPFESNFTVYHQRYHY
jgi:UDPglucose 6-dehydrogenase